MKKLIRQFILLTIFITSVESISGTSPFKTRLTIIEKPEHDIVDSICAQIVSILDTQTLDRPGQTNLFDSGEFSLSNLNSITFYKRVEKYIVLTKAYIFQDCALRPTENAITLCSLVLELILQCYRRRFTLIENLGLKKQICEGYSALGLKNLLPEAQPIIDELVDRMGQPTSFHQDLSETETEPGEHPPEFSQSDSSDSETSGSSASRPSPKRRRTAPSSPV